MPLGKVGIVCENMQSKMLVICVNLRCFGELGPAGV